jgi:hypothetical protein
MIHCRETMDDRTRPWWKRVFFALSILVLVGAVAEIAAWGGGRLGLGDRFSRNDLQARRTALVESQGRVTGRPRWLEDEILHPYIGFLPADRVLHGRAGVAGTVSGTPSADRADSVVIAVVGGSFALQFAQEGLPHLMARLRETPAFRGKTLVGLNAAAGGHKQPQQLMTAAYLLALGERIDVLINLDGFNDVALHPTENAPARVSPAYPRRWHQRVEGVLSREALHAMIERTGLENRRRRLARSFSQAPWRFLNTANLVYLVLDRRLEAQLTDVDRELLSVEGRTAVPLVATGPPIAFKNETEMLAYLVDLWRRSSRTIHDLAAGAGIRYYHFLQPNQYVPGAKPMGAAERREAVSPGAAYRRIVETAYPLLRDSGRALVADGVRFRDLSAAFADHPEPLYIDACCHVHARANMILADRIFDAMKSETDLASGPLGNAGLRKR